MDKLNRCMSENPSQIPSKYAELSEKKARPDIHQDLVNIANLTSQMQMISDSLASCHTRSRHRPMRKDWNLTSRKHTKSRNATPIETYTEEIMVERRPRGRKKSIVVNYVLNNSELLYLGKSKTFVSREEVLTKEDSFVSEKQCDRFDSLVSGSDISREIPSKTSKVGMYDYRKVDSGKMIEVLVRELRTLGELAPPVYFLVSNLSDNLFHFRECRKCHDKISPSLPWILNRIQKLIKYVIRRRQETYLWPNDYSYLKLNTKPSVEETIETLSKSKVTLVPVIAQKVVGKLEKVDPIAVFEHSPGVQIQLEVTPELEKKKFFLRSKKAPRFVQVSSFPVVQFQEPLSSLVVHVLRPRTPSRVFWQVKREVEHIKEKGIALLQVHLRQPRKPASVTVPTAESKLFIHQNKPPCPEKEVSLEEVEIPAKNLLAVLIEQSEWDRGTLPQRIYKPESNEQKELSKDLPPELIPEEANEEMQVQKVNELEEEVKELKDLMLEVHKNQTELGKLLMEKKVFSQLMVKLTDPKMLAEENNALRKASKMDQPSANSSLAGLQMIVDNLKRKCALKNMLILTLLRGLRSNVPKELWEQVIGYVFDDSESMDEIDSDKINQIIWQASVFLTEEEKERKVPPLSTRTERLSTEEEPKVKGKVGAEVEDSLENLSCYQNQASAGTKGVTEGFSTPARIWAFPIMNAPAQPDHALRKMETQITTLNGENEKLWSQIKELRELLQNSMKHSNLSEDNKKVEEVKSSGKIVSVVIQVGDKSSRRSDVITSGRKTPALGIARSESITAIHEVEKEKTYPSDGRVPIFPTEHNYGARSKTDRRRSQNDLNYLDDESLSVKNYAMENERVRGLHGLLPKTPHPSPHDMFQNFKPVSWVPSKYVIPEVYDIYGAGPSRKHGDLLQKPSMMELGEMQSPGTHAPPNERDLQTIPENDIELSPKTSHGVSQAVQLLRKRVRSLHKNMSLLKSKNDQIDKLLDKLLDDIVENNHNYEDLQSSLNNLNSRLG